jgi:hypothetical protein
MDSQKSDDPLRQSPLAMRRDNSPEGKVFRFQSGVRWSEEAENVFQLSKAVTFHLVIVMGKSSNKKGWIKVATLSNPSRPITKPLQIA